MKKFKTFVEEQLSLNEGVNDPAIFKAFITAGGPGSGKSFVSRKITAGLGIKVVVSDNELERMMKAANLTLKLADLTPDEAELKDKFVERARNLANKRIELHIQERLGIVIDGTGKRIEKVTAQKKLLDKVGYDTYMIFVNTSLDVAQERNAKRDRSLPEKTVEKLWNIVQGNIGTYQRMFGNDKFIVIDNNKSNEDLLDKMHKEIRKIIKKPPQNRIAKQWIEQQRKLKKR